MEGGTRRKGGGRPGRRGGLAEGGKGGGRQMGQGGALSHGSYLDALDFTNRNFGFLFC